jgi:hypothetical protein
MTNSPANKQKAYEEPPYSVRRSATSHAASNAVLRVRSLVMPVIVIG